MAGERTIVALTLLCEADSESDECLQWICWSIYNRMRSGRWKKTMAACCMQRFQYSEYNDDKVNNANLMRVLEMDESGTEWTRAYAIYDKFTSDLADGMSDPTNDSTHFFADYITPPGWSGPPAVFRGQQGKVRFYSNVP